MLPISIGDALFTKTQQRVLGLLYGKPDKSFYTNEIMRWADMGRGTIRRELDRLVSAGLLSATRLGNQNHYQANQDNPVYTELLGIVKKTFGVADVIRLALKPLESQIELKKPRAIGPRLLFYSKYLLISEQSNAFSCG